MALIGNLTVSVVAKTEDFDRGMKTTQASLKRTQEHAEKTSASFLSGASSALKFAGALTGIGLGVSAIGAVVQGAVGHVVNFESAMANVATLGNNNVQVQARFREELLKLPPILGDSTTLAKGLYDVLSAGIPAADAVAFLGTSASLAKAGLADVDITTQALTKTMAAFAIPTKDATQLADVLFKVVDLGQGTLQQFAGAFPQVTQGAAAMGFSFKDTAAAMATLTQTFKNADTAATGFRSMLNQLIMNGDKFAAAGINIQKVIGEEGMVGVLKALQAVTGGNVDKLHALIGDTEGFNAALALTGPQFKLFLENQGKLGESAGVVAKGLKLQGATAQSSYEAMVAEAGKAAIALSPPFLLAFTAIARGARLYAEDVNSAIASIKPIVAGTADFFTRMFASAGKGADNLGQAHSALIKGLDSLIGETRVADEATRHATLGMQLAATETDEFKTATTVLAKSLTESAVKLDANAQAARDLGAAFKLLGIETTTTMQKTATEALDAFKTILESGQATPQQIVTEWQQAMEAVTAAGFKTLPPGFEALMGQVKEIFRKAGVELPKPLRDAFGQVRVEVETTGKAAQGFALILDGSGISAEAAAANYRKLEPALDAIAGAHAEAAREAAGFGTILQRNIDLADLTLESTLKLNAALADSVYKQAFAKDEAGLQKQLAVAYKELGAAQSLASQEGQERAKTLLKEIATLKEKLEELQQTQTTQLTTATTQTDRLTASTAQLTTQTMAAASAAASAAGTYARLGAGIEGAQRLPGGGGALPLPPGSGARPMPLRPAPGAGPARPPGFNSPGRPIQRFAQGGLVTGSGGVDSVPALLTPGERVVTPGQDRAISVSFGDVVIHMSPGSDGRAAAQEFIRAMAPALNESLRRGHGEKFA